MLFCSVGAMSMSITISKILLNFIAFRISTASLSNHEIISGDIRMNWWKIQQRIKVETNCLDWNSFLKHRKHNSETWVHKTCRWFISEEIFSLLKSYQICSYDSTHRLWIHETFFFAEEFFKLLEKLKHFLSCCEGFVSFVASSWTIVSSVIEVIETNLSTYTWHHHKTSPNSLQKLNYRKKGNNNLQWEKRSCTIRFLLFHRDLTSSRWTNVKAEMTVAVRMHLKMNIKIFILIQLRPHFALQKRVGNRLSSFVINLSLAKSLKNRKYWEWWSLGKRFLSFRFHNRSQQATRIYMNFFLPPPRDSFYLRSHFFRIS